MKIVRAACPVSALLGFLVCLGIGAAAVVTVTVFVIAAALILVLNPFDLLSRTMARQSRWCLAVGFLSILSACILPFGWPVSLALVALAFGLIWYACRFNKILLDGQREPAGGAEGVPEVHRGLYYSERTNHALSALRADRANYGWELTLWERIGINETQTLLMMNGEPFDNRVLHLMRYGFLAGCICTKRLNGNIEKLKQENEAGRRLVMELEERIRQMELENREQFYETVEERGRAKEYLMRLEEAEENALRYSAMLAEKKELTHETVLQLLEQGMTGQEIAAEYGVSKATVSRLKNER